MEPDSIPPAGCGRYLMQEFLRVVLVAQSEHWNIGEEAQQTQLAPIGTYLECTLKLPLAHQPSLLKYRTNRWLPGIPSNGFPRLQPLDHAMGASAPVKTHLTLTQPPVLPKP